MPFDNRQNLTPIHSVNATYKKIVGIFIVLILIVVLIILYFSLSRAEIQLKTKSQETKINFSVQIKENVENNDFLETNILNGRILEITLEKTSEFSVKGKEESSGRYGGTMTVINEKNQSQSLVKTTRFESTNGKIFRTDSSVVVPARGSIDVYVIADGDGEEYAQSSGKFIIPGLNESSQKLVYGELKNPMAKESRTKYVLAQEDLDAAQKQLNDELKIEGAQKIKELLIQGEELSDEDITIQTLSEESSKKLGTETNKFNYTIKSRITGVVFSKEDLMTLAKNSLKNQMDKSQQLVDYNNNSLKYNIESYSPDDKTVTLNVELSANVMQNSDSEIFNTERLRGLSQEEIIDYFRNIPTIESVNVKFSPFWVKKAPKMADHIKVEIQ